MDAIDPERAQVLRWQHPDKFGHAPHIRDSCCWLNSYAASRDSFWLASASCALAKSMAALFHALAQPLKGHIQHRHKKDANRTRGQHAGEHGSANAAPAKLRSTGGDD